MFNLKEWQKFHKNLSKNLHKNQNIQTELPYILDLIQKHAEAMKQCNELEGLLDKRWSVIDHVSLQ